MIFGSISGFKTSLPEPWILKNDCIGQEKRQCGDSSPKCMTAGGAGPDGSDQFARVLHIFVLKMDKAAIICGGFCSAASSAGKASVLIAGFVSI
ncbi:hypothetical protein [Acidisoma silvae]|uniref:Uncharacterized protein n=1 Tax=Acidisoma silvae TaxID=2802396 RepID=A0A963YRX5_9PROT|nr:hypothetical protein [Acidisoma silvae]MCB8875781.1 hypothetical protein [Acidisoma silvae]